MTSVGDLAASPLLLCLPWGENEMLGCSSFGCCWEEVHRDGGAVLQELGCRRSTRTEILEETKHRMQCGPPLCVSRG